MFAPPSRDLRRKVCDSAGLGCRRRTGLSGKRPCSSAGPEQADDDHRARGVSQCDHLQETSFSLAGPDPPSTDREARRRPLRRSRPRSTAWHRRRRPPPAPRQEAKAGPHVKPCATSDPKPCRRLPTRSLGARVGSAADQAKVRVANVMGRRLRNPQPAETTRHPKEGGQASSAGRPAMCTSPATCSVRVGKAISPPWRAMMPEMCSRTSSLIRWYSVQTVVCVKQ